MENSNKEKNSIYDMLVYIMMVVAVIYVVVESILANNGTLHFKITLGIWIILAVTVADFVGPLRMGKLDNCPKNALSAYMFYAISDAVVYTGLYVFIINVGLRTEPLHYVFLGVSVILFIIKTFVYNKYKADMYAYAEKVADEEDEYVGSELLARYEETELEYEDDYNLEVNNLAHEEETSEEDNVDIKVMIYRQRNRK